MNSLKRRIGITLIAFGFDPRRTLSALRFLLGYIADLFRWRVAASSLEKRMFPLRLLPTLSDKYMSSGVASGHYFHQDLWAARQVFACAPLRHVDVGSRVDGFVAHLLSFREVEVLDIRHLESRVHGLTFKQADLMTEGALPIVAADSVSCLHALEHFGLGRYGDPLEPLGWRKGLRRLGELVRQGGYLYLGVPIGAPAIEFNAQRIFLPSYIVQEALIHGLELHSFSYIDDDGDFHENPVLPNGWMEDGGGLNYGCGCFVFVKSARGGVPG